MQRKDPEGVLGPPQTGHLARLEFKRRLERDAEAREAFQREVREEKERRQALRQVILSLLSHFLIFFFPTSILTYMVPASVFAVSGCSRYARRAR